MISATDSTPTSKELLQGSWKTGLNYPANEHAIPENEFQSQKKVTGNSPTARELCKKMVRGRGLWPQFTSKYKPIKFTEDRNYCFSGLNFYWLWEFLSPIVISYVRSIVQFLLPAPADLHTPKLASLKLHRSGGFLVSQWPHSVIATSISLMASREMIS
jgi:hypothetical protein